MSKKILVIVDVQSDFLKGGVLPYGYPEKDLFDDIVQFVRKQVNQKDYLACFMTQDTHAPTLYGKDALGEYRTVSGYLASLEGQNLPVEHCIDGTEGWKIPSALRDAVGTVFGFPTRGIRKKTFGSIELVDFVKTSMEGYGDALQDYEIEIIGFDLSICVLANAVLLRAAFPDTKITLLKSLCGDVDEASFNAALKVLQNQQINIA